MKKNNIKREEEKIKDLAKDYEKKGYQVFANPSQHDTPTFLAEMGFRPDLIATSENENLIIEVKSSQSLSTIKNIENIASRINKEPGWDFILVLTNPKEKQIETNNDINISLSDIKHSFAKVENLIEHREINDISDVIIIYMSSVLESILRIGIKEYTDNYAFKGTKSLLRDSQTLGIISRNDFSFLNEIQNMRNQISHGILNISVDNEYLDKYYQVVRRIFNEINREITGNNENYIDYLKSLSKKELDDEIDGKLSDSCYSIVEDDTISCETANTNAYAWDCDQYEIENLEFDDNKCIISIVFYLSGEQDQNRFYFGNKITGDATVYIDEKGNIEYDIQNAAIDSP